jgi:transcriptional regulator GlxA family with amidase domain
VLYISGQKSIVCACDRSRSAMEKWMCICGVHVSVQASACASVCCECGWCQCEDVCLCTVCCTINVQVRLKNSPVLYFPGQKSRVGVVCV